MPHESDARQNVLVVDVEPVVRSAVEPTAALGHAIVVHQHVEVIRHVAHGGNRGVGSGIGPNVAGYGVSATPGGPELFGDGFRSRLFESVHDHGSAFCGKHAGDSAARAAVASRDQYDLLVEL